MRLPSISRLLLYTNLFRFPRCGLRSSEGLPSFLFLQLCIIMLLNDTDEGRYDKVRHTLVISRN